MVTYGDFLAAVRPYTEDPQLAAFLRGAMAQVMTPDQRARVMKLVAEAAEERAAQDPKHSGYSLKCRSGHHVDLFQWGCTNDRSQCLCPCHLGVAK